MISLYEYFQSSMALPLPHCSLLLPRSILFTPYYSLLFTPTLFYYLLLPTSILLTPYYYSLLPPILSLPTTCMK